MLSIVATNQSKLWMKENLNDYVYYPNNKYVEVGYQGKSKAGTFNIKVYTTNLVTIEGSLSSRIYKQLVINSGEYNYTGCDEVGVGDFFGPTVFASITFDEQSLVYLSEHPVSIKDSKKLTDDEILTTYAKLKDHVKHSFQVVYDRDLDPRLNSISMKSFYHNNNLVDIQKDAIIDLYTTEKAFDKYTNELNLTWPENLILETKADSKFITVALASIFARAKFIQEMDNLDSKYDYDFPYGANNVLPTAREFVKDYSKEELATFCKTSFKTFDEI